MNGMRMTKAITSALSCLAVASLAAFCGCSGESETAVSESGGTEHGARVTPEETTGLGNAMMEQSIVATALADTSPEARLGARLFHENRLSNPGANLATSCRTCHVPPESSGGDRRYSDALARSVMPATARGSKLETLRNTPTLLDVSLEQGFNADGAFDSLEDLVAHKLTSEHMGWLPGEEDRAKDEIFALLLNDQGEDPLAEGSYLEQFKAVTGTDLERIDRDAAFDLVVASLIDYLGTIKTNNTSAYDALAYLNRFNEHLAGEGDTPQALAGRIFGRIANQEGRVLIRFPNVYNEEAYQGMKAFIRVEPTWSSSVEGMEENIANCIACHTQPKFADGRFHNIGITQMEHDAVHGDGAFMELVVDAPSESTRAPVEPGDPSRADLGRWNVDPRDATLATFKTPRLRDVSRTGPYMHNGAYATLEGAIRAHVTAAGLARAGKLRNPDPELLNIRGLSERDISNLAAFLRTLDEVPVEEYRDFRITNVRIRQDPMGEQTYDN